MLDISDASIKPFSFTPQKYDRTRVYNLNLILGVDWSILNQRYLTFSFTMCLYRTFKRY